MLKPIDIFMLIAISMLGFPLNVVFHSVAGHPHFGQDAATDTAGIILCFVWGAVSALCYLRIVVDKRS